MLKHFLPLRVYYDDTDASGIMHHSNYLKFFERGRTESLRDKGFKLNDLFDNNGVQFAIHSLQMEFIKPARLDQLLYVVTEIESMGRASIMYNQSIHLETPQGTLLCQAKLRLACLNRDLKPCALPPLLYREMEKNESK